MIGAIIGDIAGSTYEFHSIKTKDFPLFAPGSSYTDDSALQKIAEAFARRSTPKHERSMPSPPRRQPCRKDNLER